MSYCQGRKVAISQCLPCCGPALLHPPWDEPWLQAATLPTHSTVQGIKDHGDVYVRGNKPETGTDQQDEGTLLYKGWGRMQRLRETPEPEQKQWRYLKSKWPRVGEAATPARLSLL